MSKKGKYNLIGLIAAVLLLILDQWTKHLAVVYLKGQRPIALWEGVFELQYLENRGAAFGMMQGQQTVLLICTVVILILLAVLYQRLPEGKRFHPLRVIGVLLVAGAVGNMIDRGLYSYVVDFFYFKLIDFPIFNIADCYVTVGAGLIVLLFLFYYKDEDLDFLSFRKKDGRKENI